VSNRFRSSNTFRKDKRYVLRFRSFTFRETFIKLSYYVIVHVEDATGVEAFEYMYKNGERLNGTFPRSNIV